MKERTSKHWGTSIHFFVRSCTRILLPLRFGLLLLVFNGTPMTLEGKDTITHCKEQDTVQVSRGPVAAFVAIKQLGTNGGGFYGPNSTNPLENPSYFTNIVETISIFLFLLQWFLQWVLLKRRKLALMIFGVMTIGFFFSLIPSIII
jgi:K+-transporting ATPase ATPase A chain